MQFNRLKYVAFIIHNNKEWFVKHKNLYDKLLSCVTEDERQKSQRFVHEVDRWRFLIGKTLARYCVSRILGRLCKTNDLLFGEGSHGKPYVLPQEKAHTIELDFNISHSGNWVIVAAVTGKVLIGVDVAKIELDPREDLEEFFIQFGSYFSQAEWAQIRSGKCMNVKLHLFYHFWTLKESYLKATGQGIASAQLNKIEFTLFKSHDKNNYSFLNHQRCFKSIVTDIRLESDDSSHQEKFKFWLYYLDEEHVSALCCSSELEYVLPDILSPEQVLKVTQDLS